MIVYLIYSVPVFLIGGTLFSISIDKLMVKLKFLFLKFNQFTCSYLKVVRRGPAAFILLKYIRADARKAKVHWCNHMKRHMVVTVYRSDKVHSRRKAPIDLDAGNPRRPYHSDISDGFGRPPFVCQHAIPTLHHNMWPDAMI
jgi:hypothetical protein